MAKNEPPPDSTPVAVRAGALVLEAGAVGELITALQRRGYQVIGPSLSGGAIAYQPIEKPEDLPVGYTLRQEAGSCRLENRGDTALFGYVPGPRSLKNFLHPPEARLLAAERDNGAFRILSERQAAPRYAFLGVRPCDLAALGIHDRVLLKDQFPDAIYGARREGVFLVVVQCTEPASTCFCTSMGTGPRANEGFDIAITEVAAGGRIVLVAEAGSESGAEVLAETTGSEAPPEFVQQATRATEACAARFTRRVEASSLRDVLYENFEHPRWDDVAHRCFSCANCTMVCPTCFCVTVEDTSNLAGELAERWRRWDSCFTQSFSYIHGGSVRQSVKSRYRQWLTHKFAAWTDQFGTSGCVGCGRCIAWCPAGIDVTEELAALRERHGNSTTQGSET